jgi:hypothetical protein
MDVTHRRHNRRVTHQLPSAVLRKNEKHNPVLSDDRPY